ncbi:hypothetical protein O181_023911 [Austropuccinia psidii MF-1]|uniref:Uncharacterized protein n=1 Tax=Austropuccinia psidii MF-1 TaxID=1389203 RepID=A0A9Q3GY38_9BASI|nr:hypothetical protein [Austropuccinia psidii MF-1]
MTATGRTAYGERLFQSILTHSVSDTIHNSIICIHPCSATCKHLKLHYHILTCASQVLSWTNLLSLQMEDGESVMALVYQLMSKVQNFKNMHRSSREDHMMGILLQHVTHNKPSISNLVMGQVTEEDAEALQDKPAHVPKTACHQHQ